jgi:hypothetical protein
MSVSTIVVALNRLAVEEDRNSENQVDPKAMPVDVRVAHMSIVRLATVVAAVAVLCGAP